MCFRNEFATKTTKLTGYFAMALFDALLAGCTSAEVRSADAGPHSIDHVCIKENPRVKVADFVYIMEDIFSEHGISSEVFDGTPPNNCEYVVTYTTRRSWDVVPYLSYAEVKIRKDRRTVASAKYQHNGGSMSLSPMRWAGARDKMQPVIDEMLGGAPPASTSAHSTGHASPMVLEASESGITLEKSDPASV